MLDYTGLTGRVELDWHGRRTDTELQLLGRNETTKRWEPVGAWSPHLGMQRIIKVRT